jgi:hypothetical protein
MQDLDVAGVFGALAIHVQPGWGSSGVSYVL